MNTSTIELSHPRTLAPSNSCTIQQALALFFSPLRPERLPAREQLPPEDEVAGQAVAGVLEGGRFVLLEEEVAHPREAITAHGDQQQPPCVALHHGQHDPKRDQTGTDEMQHAAGGVAMLGEVEGVELLEGSVAVGGVAHGVGHVTKVAPRLEKPGHSPGMHARRTRARPRAIGGLDQRHSMPAGLRF